MTGLPARLVARLVAVPCPQLESPCLEWRGARNSCGYGVIHWKGRKVLVHRLVWWLTRRYAPKGGLVLHRCDNPPCANDEHLVQGNHSRNLRHQYRRNRRHAPREILV